MVQTLHMATFIGLKLIKTYLRNRGKRIYFNYVVVLTMSTTKEEEREFLDLCRDGDLESVENLLEENPTLIDSSNYGMTNYVQSEL